MKNGEAKEAEVSYVGGPDYHLRMRWVRGNQGLAGAGGANEPLEDRTARYARFRQRERERVLDL